ncbi:MAG: BTAD domain-containing putative transcriptional regulator, partial [Actinomycetota bacterium]
MRFLVLGPLEVRGENGEPLPISGSKERMILADLIAHAGHVVSVDDLIEEVWGDDPPRTAEKTVGSYVSRLRRALEPERSASETSDVIATRGGGYLLNAGADQIDALRFERLAEEGRLLEAGRAHDAGPVLEEALGLWRGAAYQEYRYTGFGTSEGERLEELRRSTVEDRIETRLATGADSVLIADLESMVRDEPLRERRWGQLMLALYRAGRQAEALQAFTRARGVLIEELGIEPGPDLQRLQAAILTQDPVLEHSWPSAHAEPVRSTDMCPYKGLARFETSDAEFYFGREQVVADAVARLVGGRFLALVGASGSGKSSLMRAGVLHALGSGALPGSDRWAYALIRPGEHPLESFAAALVVPESPNRLLLAVDQFEETFTACQDEAERTAFLDVLTEAALVPDGAVTIVLAMRSDYYGRCAEHRALASLLAADQILVGPMNETELRRAIELPAERADLTIDDRLTYALVADTVEQPGGLPLLSTALLELWTHRGDRTLRLDDYLRSGGVEGAVARLAEDAFGRLDRDGQAAAKRILLRLAESGDGGEVVGRRTPLSEFDLDRDTDASRALAALTGARLVTVADETAEVAHEALLRDWPRLRAWLEDDAEGRRLHRHVTASAHTWEEGGRDDGDLYRGARLSSALEWADAHDPDLNASEREFVGVSRAASESEAIRARRSNRRLRALLAGVAALLVLSLVVGDLALGQRDNARAAADVADSRQLA